MRNYLRAVILLGLLKSGTGYSQDPLVSMGIQDSIPSEILKENRKLIVNLPKDYETSNKLYPVLFLLDGLNSNLLEAIHVTNQLRANMIIVAIPNTNRNRDMMPLSTPTYEVDNPGAESFLNFLEQELIPYINQQYRSNGDLTIRGRSLSGLFVLYAFLEKPELFDHYIGNSAGWYADMADYFEALVDHSFKNKSAFEGKSLFIANSLADPYDPDQEVHHAMLQFSKKVDSELGDRILFQYQTYEHYGHVPYPSFYDGLRFVLKMD